jgi:hypothetical protein
MEGGRRIKRLEFIRETLAGAYVNQQQKQKMGQWLLLVINVDNVRACVCLCVCERGISIGFWRRASQALLLATRDAALGKLWAVISPHGPPIFCSPRPQKSAKILMCRRGQIFSFFPIFFSGRALVRRIGRYFLEPPHRSSMSESIGEVLWALCNGG